MASPSIQGNLEKSINPQDSWKAGLEIVRLCLFGPLAAGLAPLPEHVRLGRMITPIHREKRVVADIGLPLTVH